MMRFKVDEYRVKEKGREYSVLVFPFVKYMSFTFFFLLGCLHFEDLKEIFIRIFSIMSSW